MTALVVSDPGAVATLRQAALSLAEALDLYLTSYRPRLGARLPGFSRRALPPELDARARSLCAPTELLRAGLQTAGVTGCSYALAWRRNLAFDRRAAAIVPPGATVVCHYGAAEETFERAGRRILDHPIADLGWARALLEEEALRRPEWSDSMLAPEAYLPRPAHLARIARELDAADVVLVGSRFAASTFARGIRTAVVPYGADAARFASVPRLPRRGALRVLFAGQVTQRKGIADLLDAVALLDPRRVELTVAGPVIGSGRGLAGVRVVGPVARPAVPSLFAGADVLCLPSLVEGSAVVVNEALAAGLPVVVTPNAGADAVRDGVEGFVVPIRSPEEIARRLDRLAADDHLLARMSAAAAARGTTCGWEQFHAGVRALVGLDMLEEAA